MNKVVIDMTLSLDGYVAGPDDGKQYPLGRHGGMHIFDWYFSGTEEYRSPLFKPEPGANLETVKRMYEESGAFFFGRRTYEITDGAAPLRMVIDEKSWFKVQVSDGGCAEIQLEAAPASSV